MTNYPRSAYGSGNANAGKPANGDFAAWGGYRWPNCAPASLLGTTNYTSKFGQRLRVQLRSGIVELATLIFQIADKHNYCVYSSYNGENWGPWGMDCRPISGSSNPSGHSGALAMDWNAPRNAYSTTFQSDMPPAMVADIESCGWYWGGRYTGKYDAMHFSYCWAPSDVARHVAKAKAILGGSVVVTPPPTGDDSMSAADVENLKTWMKAFIPDQLQNRTEGSHSPFDELRYAVREALLPAIAEATSAAEGAEAAAKEGGNTKADVYSCVVDTETGAWYAVAPHEFWHIENMMEVSILRAAGILEGQYSLNHGDVVHLRTMVLRDAQDALAPPPPATVTVAAGDSIDKFIQQYGGTRESWVATNKLVNADSIQIGQVLTIPK